MMRIVLLLVGALALVACGSTTDPSLQAYSVTLVQTADPNRLLCERADFWLFNSDAIDRRFDHAAAEGAVLPGATTTVRVPRGPEYFVVLFIVPGTPPEDQTPREWFVTPPARDTVIC